MDNANDGFIMADAQNRRLLFDTTVRVEMFSFDGNARCADGYDDGRNGFFPITRCALIG